MGQPSGDNAVELAVAVLTVSDTRGPEDDTSGDYLAGAAGEAGHRVVARDLVPDDVYRLRAVLSAWIADPAVEVVLVTGGTGFAGRDSTPEAVTPLFDKHIVGFGEVFRSLSLAEIGSSTVQSRALAGNVDAGDLPILDTHRSGAHLTRQDQDGIGENEAFCHVTVTLL